ncbi:MAG: zinc ribbon domain-containing protein [Ruminococcaceae bacterium]|nr:zinc ribbon domain-containing protein [Oscillospiraceae bacterium]
MFCNNCNLEIADEVKFCPGCGAKVEIQQIIETVKVNADEIADVSSESEKKKKANKAKKGKKKFNKKKFLIVTVVLAVIATLVVAVGNFINEEMKLKPIKDALAANDGRALNIAMSNCYAKSSKVDDLLFEKLCEVHEDFRYVDCEFDKYTPEYGERAIEIYLREKWGTLLYPPENDDHYGVENDCIRGVIYPSYDLYPETFTKLHYIEECINGYEYYGQGMQDEANGNYLSALRNYKLSEAEGALYWKTGVATVSSDTITECLKKYLQTLQNVATAEIHVGNYNSAISVYKNGIQSLADCGYEFFGEFWETSEDNYQVEEEILHAHAEEYYEKAEECYINNNISAAKSNIGIAMAINPYNSVYQTALDKYNR